MSGVGVSREEDFFNRIALMAANAFFVLALGEAANLQIFRLSESLIAEKRNYGNANQ
jgi:hypothetical protein